jgi:hypothetical protein
MVLCDQWCGTSVHFVNGRPYNDRDNEPHVCSRAERAKEFQGYYNMIQINGVREQLKRIEQELADARSIVSVRLSNIQAAVNGMTNLLDFVEEKNRPLAKAFVTRKEKGRKRNQQPAKPEIKIASELLTK